MITADNVQIMINAVLYFQITDPVKAVYEVQDLPRRYREAYPDEPA